LLGSGQIINFNNSGCAPGMGISFQILGIVVAVTLAIEQIAIICYEYQIQKIAPGIVVAVTSAIEQIAIICYEYQIQKIAPKINRFKLVGICVSLALIFPLARRDISSTRLFEP
jgi:hypothetical protein